MNLTELLAEFEHRKVVAEQHGSTAPVAAVYRAVIDELRGLDGQVTPSGWMDTEEAAGVLSMTPKTVRRWCTDGRFPGARKTSDHGEWRIPTKEVYGFSDEDGDRAVTLKLWEAK